MLPASPPQIRTRPLVPPPAAGLVSTQKLPQAASCKGPRGEMHGSVGLFRPDVRLSASTRTLVARTMLVGPAEQAIPSLHPGHVADQTGPHDERVREASASSRICQRSAAQVIRAMVTGRSALALLVVTPPHVNQPLTRSMLDNLRPLAVLFEQNIELHSSRWGFPEARSTTPSTRGGRHRPAIVTERSDRDEAVVRRGLLHCRIAPYWIKRRRCAAPGTGVSAAAQPQKARAAHAGPREQDTHTEMAQTNTADQTRTESDAS